MKLRQKIHLAILSIVFTIIVIVGIFRHRCDYIELVITSRPNEHDVYLQDKNKKIYHILVENSYTDAYEEGTIIFFRKEK